MVKSKTAQTIVELEGLDWKRGYSSKVTFETVVPMEICKVLEKKLNEVNEEVLYDELIKYSCEFPEIEKYLSKPFEKLVEFFENNSVSNIETQYLEYGDYISKDEFDNAFRININNWQESLFISTVSGEEIIHITFK